MKVVWREWLRDKYACYMLAATFILKSVYIIINALIVVMISNTLSDVPNLSKNLAILIGVLVFQSVISAISTMTKKRAVCHCYMSMNNRYADKMLDADVDMFVEFSTAHVQSVSVFMQRITAVGTQIMDMTLSVISIVSTLYSMYLLAGPFVIPVIFVYMLGIFMMKGLYNKYTKIDNEVDKITRERNQLMENIINGFAEIRIFSRKKYFREMIHNKNAEANSLRYKKGNTDAAIIFAVEMTDSVGLGVVIIYAIRQLINGLMNQAQAVSLIMLIFRLINPMLQLLDFTSELSANLSMSDEYEKIINYKRKYEDNGKIELQSFQEGIRLQNVSFGYNSSNSILNDISMDIKKGQKIGICGSSGGGKTTIFKLLSKFYRVSGGKILIDGINVDEIDEESYHKHIGVVQQDNVIFPSTIKENIMYVDPNATEYELIDACKRANIYEFIMSLPEKFNTKVGSRGLNLSGGQKQRIAIARLLLVNPDIVLLDEATSALDNESERIVQESIDALKDKTIITIAHRLSTIKNCDKIFVLKNGRVAEVGTHDELMSNKDGEYYKMNTQHLLANK